MERSMMWGIWTRHCWIKEEERKEFDVNRMDSKWFVEQTTRGINE